MLGRVIVRIKHSGANSRREFAAEGCNGSRRLPLLCQVNVCTDEAIRHGGSAGDSGVSTAWKYFVITF